eukprot:s1517_g6.t1
MGRGAYCGSKLQFCVGHDKAAMARRLAVSLAVVAAAFGAPQGPQQLSINDEVRETKEEYREEYEELMEKYGMEVLNSELLAGNIKVLQNEVSTRDQVIRDIEIKFTEYLQGYYQNVNSEFQTLNDRLAGSTTEVREYQAELMVAAQDDEGSTMRIQDLEKKKNLAEDVAKRIYEKGMVMREEYQDQVSQLRGMLEHTEDRIHQMEANSEHVQSVANHLHCEGLEMQNQLEYSIIQYRERSEMASISDKLTNFELQKSQNEISALRESLELAQRGNYFNEESMKKIVRECRMKVSEANQQKLESDHRLRVLHSEIEMRRRQDQEQNSQAIADLRVRAQEVEDLRTQNGRLQAMLKAENETSQDYWDRLQVYIQADQARQDGLPAFGGVDRSPRVETLESEVKIQQLKINDMVDEASEYVKENLRLKDQVDPDTDRLIREPRDALEKEKGDHAVTRSYYRQVDEAYNEEVREIERLRQGNGIGNDGQVPEPTRTPTEAPNQRGSNERLPDSVGPVLANDPYRVDHPSDPPPPPEPSNRGSLADDVTSQSNYSAIDMPRISRREADKVFVPAWPKVQDVVSWQSDVAKGVILAANDGDRAAWQEWLQPALARNPNLDALNDSGGQRFQSIDTKLSIALSNMIQQAGDAGNENAPDAKAKAKPKAKAKVEAAPVLPSPSPKNHAKGKGRGRGNGTPRRPSASQSPSPKDKKKIPCHFHFVKKACKKGKDCEYSHDQKVFDNMKKKKDGKTSRSQSPRNKSPANKPKKIDEPCWSWAKGSCKFGDKCRRRHDQHLFNTAPSTPKSSAAPALLHDFDSDDDAQTAKVASTISKMRVNFNMKNVESITYEKDDFVECDQRGPRSKNRQRSSKTTDEIRKDEQWAFDCRIARSRGKAMAILMNDDEEYGGIDEVHIVIGPQYDIRIKMIEDGYGDLANEIFEENYIEHVPGKFGIKGSVMCITVPVEERDKKFIMDSGSGHDLIARRKVDRLDNEMYEGEMVNFHTANGVTSTSQMTDLNFEVFDEPVKAHVLDDTPSVLSMGKRCMEQGFSFVWPSGKDPFMIDNEGYIVKMKVKDHIPYINIDQCKEIGNKPKIQRLMNVLDDDCSTSDGESILVIDGESGDEMIERPTPQGLKKVNKTKRRRRKKKVHEVAVGSEEDYEGHVEELDDVDDDDDVYPPSYAGDAPDIEHGVEVDDAEAGEDDDEDVIDVDEEDGGPRLSKRGTLKNEARSKSHLLTHRYKNPYCESCVRAKMKHRKTFRGAFQRKLTKFGDLVTFDFVDDRQVLAQDYG